MVPVRLKLRNFLSYGEGAEPLDFSAFHVACLSGGNGQGKSALLDAMTWAIWGQARKSSEARKPDEELLRVGTREMEVDLIFELEGTRYRVLRSYYRTASGKTSKPGLEFQIDDGTGGWRTLTGTTIAETQEAIERAIRLDYDTFINSAFLLQGRSDEFTKKRSSERKQILARILGLDRFAQLEKAARARYAESEAVCHSAASEVERLKDAVGHEAAWREELAATEVVASEKVGAVEELRTQLTTLAERIAELDSLASREQEQRRRLEASEGRRVRLREEGDALAQRITQAGALIQQADRIARDHERYLALDAERTLLDEQREQKQGLEEQALRLRETLQQRRLEQQGRLDRLDAQQSADRKACSELRVRLAERPAVATALDRAARAQAEAAAMKKTLEERQTLQQRMESLDKRLLHERSTVEARIEAGQQRLRDLGLKRKEAAAVQRRCVEVTATLVDLPALREQLEELQARGTQTAGELAAAQSEASGLEAAAAAMDERLERLRALDTETCPTCGTELTDDHRAEMDHTYVAERSDLDDRLRLARKRVASLSADRLALGERYRTVRNDLEKMHTLEAELAGLRGRLEAAQQDADVMAATEIEIAGLEERLRGGEVVLALGAELTRLSEALMDLPFDEERYEEVREEAAQLARYEAEQRSLDEVSGRLETLTNQLHRREEELGRLRQSIAVGETEGPLREQLDALTARARALAYDGARHEEVRREMATLREAPRRFVELGHALNNSAEWKERRARLADDLTRLDEEVAALGAELERTAERLGERPAHVAARASLRDRLALAEAEVRDVQARRGALEARLKQCEHDRRHLEERRRQYAEARRERALYDHLRRAFGRNGIPALIIEQTVPEVEERANALLERLSGGRTRVHLETLRDKKAGGTRETLDIRITDHNGVSRAYETFSGGEAFRVNFALRIALAQLLADRAGVRIRTLVVDEGFGTQDKQGLEALVDSIQAIQGDFEKVLVITHLDELKEAFPIRIEVEKDPVEGSSFQVVGV